MERDSHGNFQFSQVPTDKVIMGLVKDYLNFLKEEGIYRLGIRREYFHKTLKKGGLDPDTYGPVLFENYKKRAFLLRKSSIISLKTLEQALARENALTQKGAIPPEVEKIFRKSVPDFKTQTHFYGYDGRGTDPTRFDCNYTYNLGLTVFSLIANGATGQMAAASQSSNGLSSASPRMNVWNRWVWLLTMPGMTAMWRASRIVSAWARTRTGASPAPTAAIRSTMFR